MAPVKFGLFKTRSRDQEQPSTENLLRSVNSHEHVIAPSSPVPSTSHGRTEELNPADIASLNIDSDDEDIVSERFSQEHLYSESEQSEKVNVNYQKFSNHESVDATSISTLQDDELDQIQYYEENDPSVLDLEFDRASTSCDVNSLQYDVASLAPSEDMSVYCGTSKKNKKNKVMKVELSDINMWRSTNMQVMQNILNGSGSLDERIKWQAIATARGLCTLTNNCTCEDCFGGKYLHGMTDGDAGLGSAPLVNALSVGCTLQ